MNATTLRDIEVVQGALAAMETDSHYPAFAKLASESLQRLAAEIDRLDEENDKLVAKLMESRDFGTKLRALVEEAP